MLNVAVAIVGGLACAMIIFSLLFMLHVATPVAAAVAAPNAASATAGFLPSVSCAPDGVAISTTDYLRTVVQMLDRTILTGRGPDGRPMSIAQTTQRADAFAAGRTSPDVTAAVLAQCGADLRQEHAHGYWMVSAALVREAARRRGVEVRK